MSVCDDGPGFPVAYLPHAFDRFSRPDQGRTRAASPSGTGLGLAVVKSLTTLMGGAVTATNRATGGAEIQIDLPLTANETADPSAS